MAQQQVVSVLSVDAAASGSNVTSGAIDCSHLKGPWVAVLEATRASGASTLDIKIQDALTPAGPWFDWITFTQLNGSGNEQKVSTRDPLPCRRTNRSIGATTTYDIDVNIAAYYA